MANAKVNHAQTSNKILKDLGDALKQKETSTEALDSRLRDFRKMNGIMSSSDLLKLSADIMKAIRYLAEHDHLAYLTLIKRYDLIRKLFWQKDLFEKLLAFMEELEKDKAKEKHQQQWILEEERWSSLNKQKQHADKATEEQRRNDERALINSDVYHYLLLLEQNIHYEFHEKQTQVYLQAFESRISRMKKAIQVTEDHPDISSKDKQKFRDLLSDYEREKDELIKIKTVNEDGSIDYHAAEMKYIKARDIDEKYATLFAKLLEEHSIEPQIADILQKERTATQQYQQIILRNEAEYEQRLAEIKPHIEKSRTTVKENLETVVSEITNIIKACSVSVEQQTILGTFLKELNIYKNSLDKIQVDHELSELSKKILLLMDPLEKMMKPLLTQTEYQKLERQIISLNGIESSFYANLLAKPRSTLPISEQVDAGNIAQESNEQRNMDTTRFFRRLAQREQESSTQLFVFEEEQQEYLEKKINGLSDLLSKIKDKSDLSPIENTLILQSEEFCDDILKSVKGEVNLVKMELLIDSLDELKTNHKTLNRVSVDLRKVMKLANQDERPSMQV